MSCDVMCCVALRAELFKALKLISISISLQTLYEKVHAVHQNFNKFQNRGTDGNINAPKWIRHLGDAYNIIRKTRGMELPEDWTIARLQEELSKSRDFVTDLSPDHPTLRHELLTDDERRQVEEAFAVHVEGAYYEVGEEGEEKVTSPTLQKVCETVIAWLRTVPTTFVSVDKFRRSYRASWRGARNHHSAPHAEFTPVGDSSVPSTSQGRPYQRSYPPSYASKTSPTKPTSTYGKSSYNRNYNSDFPPQPLSPSHNTESHTTTLSNGTSGNVTSPGTLTDTANDETCEKANTAKMSRQVDSSYRLSGNFDPPTSSNSEAATDSNNESNDESTGNESANDSNESAPESSNPESPSESSAESSNDHEFAWSSIINAVPREPLGTNELLEIRLEPANYSEPANLVTNEVTPPPPPPSLAFMSFNETSFGMFKRSSLPTPSNRITTPPTATTLSTPTTPTISRASHPRTTPCTPITLSNPLPTTQNNS